MTSSRFHVESIYTLKKNFLHKLLLMINGAHTFVGVRCSTLWRPATFSVVVGSRRTPPAAAATGDGWPRCGRSRNAASTAAIAALWR